VISCNYLGVVFTRARGANRFGNEFGNENVFPTQNENEG
jgi:hypothetical protein